MSRFFDALERVATGRGVLLLFLVVVVVDGVLIGWVAPRIAAGSDGGRPLDISLVYSADEAYERLAAFSDETRSFYLATELTLDMVFPAAYSVFFAALILFLLRRGGGTRGRLLALLPIATMCADFLENAAIATLLVRYPERLDGVASAAGILTLAKWVLVGVTVGAIVFAWAMGRSTTTASDAR